jgi:putative transposase
LLLRDRDSKYSVGFDEIFRTEGAKIFTSPVRAPNANGHAERWVRTIRQECLDHILIISRRHLEAVLAIVRYALQPRKTASRVVLCTPEPRAVVAPTKLVPRLRSKKILGGLIHEYELAA